MVPRPARGWLILGMSFLLVTGCSSLKPWRPLTAGRYVSPPQKFAAPVPAEWMRKNFSPHFQITRDGVPLEGIEVKMGSLPLKALFTERSYTPQMTPVELAEIARADLQANPNMRRVRISRSIPVTIGGRPGFRLEFSFRSADDLPMRGVQCGFRDEDRMYHINFFAASQYYYDHYLPDFERFLEGFELLDEDKDP